MRRLLTRSAFALVTVLPLAACGDDRAAVSVPAPVPIVSETTTEPPAAEPSVTTTVAANPARTTTHRAAGPATGSAAGGGLPAFVRDVQATAPEIAIDRRDEEIEAIAQQACASLAAGKKAKALIAETRALGTPDAEATDQATARELIKLAIDTVCTDRVGRIDEF
jgi:hypothetical protein